MEQCEVIARVYEDRWSFPNCIGSVDAKHIAKSKPKRATLITLIIKVNSVLFY